MNQQSLKLYHFSLSPLCRFVRVLLNELNIECEMFEERYWNKSAAFMRLHARGEVPLLVAGNVVISGVWPITQYIFDIAQSMDVGKSRELLSGECGHNLSHGEYIAAYAHTRSITDWFNDKFFNEVSDPMISEKVIKPNMGEQSTNSNMLRVAQRNLLYHLDYIEFLISKQCRYISGDRFSIGDIAAAAHISSVDFLGMVSWQDRTVARNWYSIIKSRPSFGPILRDFVVGVKPSPWYSDLDF